MRTIRNSEYSVLCEVITVAGKKRVQGTLFGYGTRRKFNVKLAKDGTFVIGFSGSGNTRFRWTKSGSV
jgi:hypothetical protein